MHLSRGTRRVLIAAAIALIAAGLVACSAPQTTIEPRSDNADTIQTLYIFIFWLSVIVFAGVLIATVLFSLWFRERPDREARQFHGNTRLEVVWTLIPVVIVVLIAVPTLDAIFDLSADPPEDALEVEVIGHQWWFEFRYPELGVVTANELRLPVGRATNFTLLSADVIHSFWVPQLAGKVDLVPGHDNDLWFTPDETGMFLGQCAEFCGASHARMRFRVFVLEPGDFDAWAAKEAADRAPPAGDAEAGEAVFLAQACVGCHTVQGTIAAGLVGPNLTHVGGRETLAAGIMDNTPENMARWIRNAPETKPGSLMPAFPELSDADLQAIVSYLQALE